ncbi:hypothetical protein ILUMI_04952 [Ignelater luminosus]|uniref:N-acetylgalactosaminide beta-1,3-galactosyltransferase n=1 Tax=Ignelater luminosus TaxID=2038154 RepID=A0A8K0DDH0_IGNLU|nr:hypothetical protein ILUMI_04952 [Ignelater luminosus]
MLVKRMNMNQHHFFTLLVGMLIGFMIATYLILSSPERCWPYLQDLHINREVLSNVLRESHKKVHHRMENSAVADYLAKKVRILCLVMTEPENHINKAVLITYTWGERCNILSFISSGKDEVLPSIILPVTETGSWGRTKESLKYVYKYHLHKIDWILLANDDTYFVLENLRLMLMNYNESKAIYFEHQFPYNSEESKNVNAGRILSREAIRKIVEVGLSNPNLCNTSSSSNEDVELHKCMKAVHVRKGNSLDSSGKNRILPFVDKYYFELGANKVTSTSDVILKQSTYICLLVIYQLSLLSITNIRYFFLL